MSEFSKILSSGSIVKPGGFDGIFVATEVNCFPVHLYVGNKTGTNLSNSLISSLGIFSNCPIHAILGCGARSKIMAAIVETISISMVDPRSIKNNLVHKQQALFLVPRKHLASRIEKATSAGRSKPLPLTKPIVVDNIDNGEKSSSQSNKAIFWFGWDCHEFAPNGDEVYGWLHSQQSHSTTERVH